MIYEIKFDDEERIEYCTARDILHLLQSYAEEFEFNLLAVVSVVEITEEAAKDIVMINEDGEYESLHSLAIGEDFNLIASNQWD